MVEKVSELARKSAPVSKPENWIGPKLEQRRTPELVFGMVGLVGSGVSTTATVLKEMLTKDYKYDHVQIHKVSEIIAECGHLVGLPHDHALEGAERIQQLQEIGSRLRKKFAPGYLAKKCVESIAVHRDHSGGYLEQDSSIALPKRNAHIIDSIKHPEEVKLLRAVYGEIFWLITVFAPEDVREKRLVAKEVKRADLSALMERDRDEGLEHGQHVQKTSHLADFFVRNNHSSEDPLKATLGRYLEILFGTEVHSPLPQEAAMYSAASAAARSACLSRQVGAAIVSPENELIGVGWNDVPEFSGGLYSEKAGDQRCYRWGHAICHNDDRKLQLYEKIFSLLKKSGMLIAGTDQAAVKSLLATTDIKNLIEYSRAVHAEMEAIISVARSQKAGLLGSTMYVTTFPCHSCARHIVAAGIKQVYFIEPYSKSLAGELHEDSVSTDERDHEKKVVFLQYEGVAPKNMIKLFNHGRERKRAGKALKLDKSSAEPVFVAPLDGYATMEQIVVKELHEEENRQSARG